MGFGLDLNFIPRGSLIGEVKEIQITTEALSEHLLKIYLCNDSQSFFQV